MPLQFVLGPSGSGKSTYLYRMVLEGALKNPEETYIVLVPEQFTLQTQKELVELHPRHALMNVDVLSFERLAYRVFNETGQPLPLLDEEGKSLVLRKVASDREKELSVLKGNAKKAGYIREIKSLLSEFMQYDIGPEELRRMIEKEREGSLLACKLRDMEILYEGFLAYLEKSYVVKEGLLDILAKLCGQSEFLAGSTLVLDGFTGFTPRQQRVLSHLMDCCKKIVVTATVGRQEDAYHYTGPFQLFARSKKMIASLCSQAEEKGLPVEKDILLFEMPAPRFREREDLAFLEENLFRKGREAYPYTPERIWLRRAGNPKEEAGWTAQAIRKLIRKEGYRYREIGVIAGDMELYGDYLTEAFEQYQIPCFLDRKRNILLHPYLEHIRSLLYLLQKNFSVEGVFRFLRSDFSLLSRDAVDQLENYVIGMGIKGGGRWDALWDKRLRFMAEEELTALNQSRTTFLEQIREVREVARKSKKTVGEMTRALYGYMVSQEHQKKLKQAEETLLQEGEPALAKEYSQIYRAVLEVFDKFVDLLGEENIRLEEYCQLLDAGLAEARIGVIPPSPDQVVAGDLERTRMDRVKVLFFVGAGDHCLPGNLSRNGLLTEQERERFEEEKLVLAAGGKEQAYIQKFDLYRNLTKASDRLIISYSQTSSEGRSIRPSYLMGEIRRLYPSIRIEAAEEPAHEREWTEESGIEYLINGWQKEQMDDTWKEIRNWLLARPGYKKEVEKVWEAFRYSYLPQPVGEEDARILYGEAYRGSVTRLEKFSTCAFAHFLAYGLRLRERQEYGFQKVDLGNVCHDALERYAKRIREEGKTWTQLTRKEQEAWSRQSVEEAVEEYGNQILKSTARNAYTAVRVQRLMDWSVWALTRQLAAGEFEPVWEEKEFGHGKIDRVDVCMAGDKAYLKIMDYKTGRKELDLSELYDGLQMQLMIYMREALKLGRQEWPDKEILPAGMFYYRVQEPWVQKLQPKEKESEAELQKKREGQLLAELKPDGVINGDKEILRHLNTERQADILPLKWNKDGTLAAHSKVLTEEEFWMLLDYAQEKSEEISDRILKGEADIRPYRKQNRTGCDYCPYSNICRFDKKVSGFSYKELEAMKKEEVLERLRMRKGGDGDEVDEGSAESH